MHATAEAERLFTIEMWREIERSYPRGTERGWILYWSFRDEEQRDRQLEQLKAFMPDRRWRSNSAPAAIIRGVWYPDLARSEMTPARVAHLKVLQEMWRVALARWKASSQAEKRVVDALYGSAAPEQPPNSEAPKMPVPTVKETMIEEAAA
jgi:hypothetical protein